MQSLIPLLALLAMPALALDIPRHVFRLNNLEEAKAQAAEKKQPLVFVYTDPGTT